MSNLKPTRTALLWTAMAALVVPLVLTAVPTADAATTTTRTLAITTASAGPKVSFAAFDGNPIKVYDINRDGQLEIIAQNDNQYVYVFDSVDGDLLAEVKTRFPQGWGARSFNGPEVTILEDGGQVRMVVANSAAFITVYRFDPLVSTKNHFSFTKEWDLRLNHCHPNPGMDAKPVFADLDRDGNLEILAATEEEGIYALRSDGTILWKRCIAGGNAEPGVNDVNRDGWPDVVFGSDGGHVTAMDGRDGSTLWHVYLPHHFNIGAGSMPVGPAVVQLNGKGGPDTVFGVRDSHDANDQSNNHALLVALGSDGRILWGVQHPQANPLTYTRPVVVDADGDGQREVYWGDWNTVGHKPPWDEAEAWQRTGPANFYRYDAGGNLVWRQSLDTFWSNKDIVIGDVDDDGVQEVLANGPRADGHDGVWYLNAKTGAKEAFVDLWPWKMQRPPVLADLWGTGTMQWVVAGAPYGSGSGGNAILVYDTHAPYDAAWPHVPYVTATPGAPPPEPSGTFDATFRIKAPNEWWQELYVEPDEPRSIANAQVRIDGGSWKAMSKSSWGAWTSSYNTPAGTQVEFRATAGNGDISKSAAFTWMDGTTTRRGHSDGSTPTPTPAFEATFELSENVNEWWVEVFVDGNQPISAVDVRVNGGAWQALTERSWGSWAESMHVAPGSQVEFRATSSTGERDVSKTFTWMSEDGTAFAATFDPRAQGNDWWVETAVSANKPVAKVEARIVDEPWHTLSPTDWGTWAKSFHVPDGSEIQFRATSGGGETVLSGTYTW